MSDARRHGLWMRKVGMSRSFLEDGSHVPVTLLRLEPCHVVAIRAAAHQSVRLSFGVKKEKNVNKAERGVYQKAMQKNDKMLLPAFSKEFRVGDAAAFALGDELTVAHFVVGQKVDVRARSKGRGFSGVIKRHNFSGLAASHGVSISHRSHGSTGHSQDPGRVFKGKKMAGQYGNRWCRVQNLEVVAVDEANALIVLRGGVPGAIGGHVQVTDAIKHPAPVIEKAQEAETAETEAQNEEAAS